MFYNRRGEGEIVLLCVCRIRAQKRIIFLRKDETKKYGEKNGIWLI